jgi:hypothetical protein
MNEGEKKRMDERIAQLRLKRMQIRSQFMNALNNGRGDDAGRLDEEDRRAYNELYQLLAERARQ